MADPYFSNMKALFDYFLVPQVHPHKVATKK